MQKSGKTQENVRKNKKNLGKPKNPRALFLIFSYFKKGVYWFPFGAQLKVTTPYEIDKKTQIFAQGLDFLKGKAKEDTGKYKETSRNSRVEICCIFYFIYQVFDEYSNILKAWGTPTLCAGCPRTQLTSCSRLARSCLLRMPRSDIKLTEKYS